MYYVYIIKSTKDESYYKGCTEDLKTRVKDHNRGKVSYSSSKTPYVLVWYYAFKDKKKAYDFEKYIKSGSGFAFVNKHIL